jgi:hypothetical protein
LSVPAPRLPRHCDSWGETIVIDAQPEGEPVLKLGQGGLSHADGVHLMQNRRKCYCREPEPGDRDEGGDAVMLPVDRTGIRGDQDGGRHEVVVEGLDRATGPPVVPGPAMIEGGGEERRVVFGRLFAGRFADGHPGCWRKRASGVNEAGQAAARAHLRRPWGRDLYLGPREVAEAISQMKCS